MRRYRENKYAYLVHLKLHRIISLIMSKNVQGNKLFNNLVPKIISYGVIMCTSILMCKKFSRENFLHMLTTNTGRIAGENPSILTKMDYKNCFVSLCFPAVCLHIRTQYCYFLISFSSSPSTYSLLYPPHSIFCPLSYTSIQRCFRDHCIEYANLIEISSW